MLQIIRIELEIETLPELADEIVAAIRERLTGHRTPKRLAEAVEARVIIPSPSFPTGA